MSHPQLVALANSYTASPEYNLSAAIVYEHTLGDEIHRYSVRAFPTYILFERSREVGRVQGVNFAAVQEMVEKSGAKSSWGSSGQGQSLGSAGGVEDVKAARLARLAALEQSVKPKATADAVAEKEQEQIQETAAEQDVDMSEPAVEHAEVEEQDLVDPTANLDAAALDELTSSMGFPLIRAQKGLLFGGNTAEGAVDWLLAHQDDDDIDIPIPLRRKSEEGAEGDGSGGVAQSYKCNECGKILSNMANLELHANKTGHSDFSESTTAVKPLTEEEKKKKMEEIKGLLAAKRAERLATEKEDDKEREKRRRFQGQEMAKTREQVEAEQRKRDVQQRKREKEAFKRERERIRRELEKDKLERMANKGKLQSKLGVEGYHPDAIQYDQDVDVPAAAEVVPKKNPVKSTMKVEDCIQKVSSYRAGGDGEKCLKVLLAYVKNVVENEDEKFRTINMENKAFKTRVKPFIGGKQLLLAVGFLPGEHGDKLVLSEDADNAVLAQTKDLLEKAISNY